MTELEGLAGAIDLIQSSARDSVSAKGRVYLHELPDLQKLLIFKNDGSYTELANPQPWSSKLESVDQVGRAVEHFGAELVLYHASGVTIVIDQKDTRNRIFVPLEFTDTFKWLQSIKDGKEFTPDQLIRALRNKVGVENLDGRGHDLLQYLRGVKFTNGETSTQRTERSNESLDRSMLAEVQTETAGVELPEAISVTVDVYTDRALREEASAVELLVDAHPSMRSFSLTPAPQRLDDAVEYEMQQLGDFLLASVNEALGATGENSPSRKVPVMYGALR